MSFSIIIPTRNPSNILALTESIYVRDPASSKKVIIVDDDETGNVTSATWGGQARRIDGKKPFIFARNINLGIAAAGDDVILCNDDTRLLSDFGFGYLSTIANENPQYGIISAGITGAVGNTEQIAQAGTRLRTAQLHTLVYVCVYIRREALNKIGPMDERYVAYGSCDNDHCASARKAGFKLGIFDGCVVEHGVLPSSFRHGKDIDIGPGLEIFREKWGCYPGQLKFPHEIPQVMQPDAPISKAKW